MNTIQTQIRIIITINSSKTILSWLVKKYLYKLLIIGNILNDKINRNANEENKYRASYEYEEEEDFGGNIRY